MARWLDAASETKRDSNAFSHVRRRRRQRGAAMPESEFEFRADDGQTLLGRRWLPGAPPRAIVQIAHGLAEHSARYARLAAALNAAGYAAYANDHRGHGPKAAPAEIGRIRRGCAPAWVVAAPER